MTNSNRATPQARRARAARFLPAAVLCVALPALADPAPAPALRLSGELTMGAVAMRSPSAAEARAAATQPVAAEALAGQALTMRDYRIGADDLLEIQVFGVDQLTRTVRVNGRGMVSLPLVGAVEVGGLTAQQAEARIVKLLGDTYLQDPQVSLFIKEYTSQRVIIEGAVNKPGVYPLRGPTTLLQSLAVAGGQGSLSDMSEVMLFRTDAGGKREAFTFDVEKIRAGEIADPVVVNEDMIVVKRSAGRILFRDSILRDIVDTINPFR